MKKIKLTISSALLLFVIILASLGLSNFFLIKFYKAKQTKDSALIDASGRNRMLSQKIGFYAEMLVSGKETARPILSQTINLHDISLNSLKNGGVAPGIGNEMMLSEASEDIMPVLLEAEKVWQDYKKMALVILNESDYTGNTEQKDEVQKAISFIEKNANTILVKNNQLVKAYVAESMEKQARLDLILVILLVANVLLLGGGFWFARSFIIRPIRQLAKASEKVASGDSHENKEEHTDPDIIRISTSIDSMGKNIEQAAKFSASIGSGQFDYEFDVNVQENRLFTELSNMRVKLIDVAEEDKRRNWVTQGLASFGEILRANDDDVKSLGDKIISKMVKYLSANQGSLFVLNDDDRENSFMELLACYAWERKKFIEKKINQGQGLIGQSWMEGDIIYMTEIPKDYITITSGLGEATPTSLLIVPLIVNDEIYGILEIASFNEFEDYQIDFVKRVGENIASTLSSTKVNQHTHSLLEQSQQQAEEMRAQEEEMRQNMEEMQATQEEMGRNQAELNSVMNAINSANVMIEFEPNGNILRANQLFLDAMGYTSEELEGRHHKIFVDFSETDQNSYEAFWAKLRSGKHFSGEIKRITKEGNPIWLISSYTPIKNTEGQIYKVVKIARDVTNTTLSEANYKSQINAINKSQAVIEFDLKGNIKNANQLFLDLMGYTLQEIIGEHHSIFCEKGYSSSAEYKEFWTKLGNGEFVQGDFKRLKKDGNQVHLKATYTPIMDMKGRPDKVIKFASEIKVLVEDS